MNVCITLFDSKNDVIGEASDIFSDPRAAAETESRHVGSTTVGQLGYTTLTARLDRDKVHTKISSVKTIAIVSLDLS